MTCIICDRAFVISLQKRRGDKADYGFIVIVREDADDVLPALHFAGRWRGSVTATLVTMPETAMHEDEGTTLQLNKARSTLGRLQMEPELETARVQRATQR
jgi:hypothetical protein